VLKTHSFISIRGLSSIRPLKSRDCL
jgi:hypothetical protein